MFLRYKKAVAATLLALFFIGSLSVLSIQAYGVTKSSPKASVQKKAKASAKTKSKAATKCDKNYSGCVPVAKDVDCKPGKGDGPAYITKPVKVLKKDIYRLDSDKDGMACEKN